MARELRVTRGRSAGIDSLAEIPAVACSKFQIQLSTMLNCYHTLVLIPKVLMSNSVDQEWMSLNEASKFILSEIQKDHQQRRLEGNESWTAHSKWQQHTPVFFWVC